MNKNRQNKQDQKFNHKLNHLQGFVGLANWNFESPSFDEIKAYDNHGRNLQSKAIFSALKRMRVWLKAKFK